MEKQERETQPLGVVNKETTQDYPVLDNLTGMIGDKISDHILRLVKIYKNRPHLTLIVCGIPGSGKSTLIEELHTLFFQHQFHVEHIEYELAFKKSKPLHKSDMDSKGWKELNKLLRSQVQQFQRQKQSTPAVCLVEIPGIAEKFPTEEQASQQGNEEQSQSAEIPIIYNRDRGVSFLLELSKTVGYEHIFVLSLTSDPPTQQAAMGERRELLTSNPSQEEHDRISRMATTTHLEKMISELYGHMPQLIPTLSEEPLHLILRLRGVTSEEIQSNSPHYKQELDTLRQMFTQYQWLIKLKVQREHILLAHNAFRQELTGGHRKKFHSP